MLEAVFFDYDGTISPTSKRQEGWFRHYSQMHGKAWPFSTMEEFLREYNKQLHKPGGVQNFYDLLSLPCDINDKSHPVWGHYHSYVASNPSGLYPGMKETVEKIWRLGSLSSDASVNRRLRIGINTTNTWANCYKDLEKHGLLPYFDCFITEEVLAAYHGDNNGDALKKPSTISIALMLAQLNTPAGWTLHVGDTLNDLRASHKVMVLNPAKPESVITVGACYGYEGRSALEQGVELVDGSRAHFDYLIDAPLELVDIVRSLRA